ncbi:metallophosphoesterase [Pyxidicoccus fallax]|uniref:Metallophosphoesterase n=1 Tax=Pyxidicoccus fallax TaxID=394095 RepID=A0A848L9Z9_9BACT|nr:metallophosphoesterase [Pyxidicoccus fallax]NMO15082.1 metallophosphoesterase [Pyxidicoccus fallax]NPC79804.1 metallophosphoesterase [Pyxidicoccus fallax]
MRIAAVGDIHAGLDSAPLIRAAVEHLRGRADILVVAGDLTQHGSVEEAQVVARELARLELPMFAVLGNHDYHMGAEQAISATLEDAGVRVLEGKAVVCDVDGVRVAVAGVKGFGCGFAGACGTEFGEPEMKLFVRRSRESGEQLARALATADANLHVALTHFSPVKDTLLGERPEIHPFLGSFFLADAIDQGPCDVAFHGHAHNGTEWGLTAGGVPVRNVARFVLRAAYKVYELDPAAPPGSRLR